MAGADRMKCPEVSICIPTYNGAAYLDATLESARRQSFDALEIVVTDDASTDGSLDIARSHQLQDARVKVFEHRQRAGLVQNWNRCFLYARGRWIKFLFQDDILDDHCIRDMVGAARKADDGSDQSLVVCDRGFLIEPDAAPHLRFFYENSVMRPGDVFPDLARVSAHEMARAILEKGVGVNFIGEPTSVLLPRHTAFQYGFFDTGLVQLCDLEYWTRLGTHVGLTLLPQKLCFFRVHDRSASSHNHTCRRFEVSHGDRLILLHNYLFHPWYRNLRRVPNAESILVRQLQEAIQGLLDDGLLDTKEARLGLGNLTSLYPILRRFVLTGTSKTPDDVIGKVGS